MTAHAPAWTMSAACASSDPEVWFPDRHSPDGEAARRICASCPVAGPCLADAMRTEGSTDVRRRYGIRGGLGPTERAALYRAAPGRWTAPGAESEPQRARRLHAAGYEVGSIAALLDVTPRTVNRYVTEETAR